jgi:flagellar basal-body rod modification protein FlgD
MSLITNEITSMQNQTAFYKLQENRRNAGASIQDANDSNMFLTLMLQQLQNQDPTEPTDNTEWLAQLAQYSSLEQMTNMNKGLANCMGYLASIYNDMTVGSEITQTLSLIGKEVTIKDPDDETGNTLITGKVTEASFEDGTGKIKVGDKYYSIAYIVNVKDGNGNDSVVTVPDGTESSDNPEVSEIPENAANYAYAPKFGKAIELSNLLNKASMNNVKAKLKDSNQAIKPILKRI